MPYSPPPGILVESPPQVKISAMTAAAALTGAELVPLVQGGANVRSTVTAIAAMASATPSAPLNSLQYNNAGAFGGSANAVFDGVNKTTLHTATVSTGDLTVTPGIITTGAATSLQLKTLGGTQVEVAQGAATTVNRVLLHGAATTFGPNVQGTGTDANVTLNISTKGTGPIVFYTDWYGATRKQFAVQHNTSSNGDIVEAEGLGVGNSGLTARGINGNINMNFTGKGIGLFNFWKTTALSGQQVFQVITPAGTPGNYPTVRGQPSGTAPILSVEGVDTNIGLHITSKGTTATSIVGVTRFGTETFPLLRINTGTAGNTALQIANVSNNIELTVLVQGGLTNQNLIFKPAGTGSVIQEPGSGTTLTVATSAATTVNLYNSVATTINFGGAATTLNIGQAGQTVSFPGTITAAQGLRTSLNSALVTSTVAMTNGAGAGAGTLTNAPAAGDPTKWVPIDDNGTIRYIPAW